MKLPWRGLFVAMFLISPGVLLEAELYASGVHPIGQHPPIDVSDTEPARSFVVNYIDYTVSSAGIVRQTGTTLRYVKADGEWRLEHRRNSGPTEATVYGGTPDGVFEKNRTQSRRYVSPSSDQTILRLYRSNNYLRNHPEFVRTDEVAGFKVYVMRTEVSDTANPQHWEETSYSPKTGLTVLKFVVHFSDGSESRRDAVSVEFKDVPDDLNQDLKNLPTRPKAERIQ